MKGHGAVYRKLREVKYRHLVALYKKYLAKTPENCRYNYRYRFISDEEEREIRLCLIHQENIDSLEGVNLSLVDVCEKIHHCSRCNGFVPRYTKDDIKEVFDRELSDRSIREKKYPDICALEWVLEKSVPGPFLIRWPMALYFTIKRALFKNRLL